MHSSYPLLASVLTLLSLPSPSLSQSTTSNSNSSTPIPPFTLPLSEFLPITSADSTHATPRLATFFTSYFTAKSSHNTSIWASFYNPSPAIYADATVGQVFSQPNISAAFAALSADSGPHGYAYPLRLLGDTSSAIAIFVDSPELFGEELRIITAVDFVQEKEEEGKNGTGSAGSYGAGRGLKGLKILRQEDHWDPRTSSIVVKGRVPASEYPTSFNESLVTSPRNPVMQRTVDRFAGALAAGNMSAAMGMMSADAVLEDWSVRTRIDGRLAIGRYLGRAGNRMPWGVGSNVTHVLGNELGGGYEWRAAGQRANGTLGGRVGITAIELDGESFITRLTSVWDSFEVKNETMYGLAGLAIEP